MTFRVARDYLVDVMQPSLGIAPLNKVRPKHDPADGRKTRFPKPRTGAGVGNPGQHRKLFGVQCLIQAPFFHDII